MDAIQIIKKYWGWTGIRPARIVDRNAFGNLIVEDSSGRFWRICPEEGYCRIIAKGLKDFRELMENKDFLEDWNMTALAVLAGTTVGEPEGESCYHFLKPGDFSPANIGLTTFSDLIIDSGIAAEEKDKEQV